MDSLPLLARPAWLEADQLKVVDETALPETLSLLSLSDHRQAIWAIKEMKTRAYGQLLTAVYALLLTAKKNAHLPPDAHLKILQNTVSELARARATFPIKGLMTKALIWAEEAVRQGRDLTSFLEANIEAFLHEIDEKRRERAHEISQLIEDGQGILTHCNLSGEMVLLARLLREQGKEVRFFVTETRPYLQGSRLTAWELLREGFPVTVLADAASSLLMERGQANLVLLGSDRWALNGDIANKVGTYQLAVACKVCGIPFYVMAQKIDPPAHGSLIPEEVRDEEELLTYHGHRLAPEGVRGYYPSFDVTPASYITDHFFLSDGEWSKSFASSRGKAPLQEAQIDASYTLLYGVPDETSIKGIPRDGEILLPELRPSLEGARVSASLLLSWGFKVTLISDNMMAHCMKKGMVKRAYIFYHQRLAGGFLARAGSGLVALLAREHGVPYEWLPTSFPLRQPRPEEIHFLAGKRIIPQGAKAFYPFYECIRDVRA